MKVIKRWRRTGHANGDAPIIGVIGVIYIVCLLVLNSVGINGLLSNAYLENSIPYACSLIVILSAEVVRTLWISRPGRPVAFLKKYFAGVRYRHRVLRSLPIIFALIVFMPIFSTMKSSIPLFTDYTWDQTFIDLDRAIHGTDPWRLLQPVLGYPIVTSAIAGAYHVWILLIYMGGIYFALYESDQTLRRRYFVSFFGVWIVCGILLATRLASVGPCFVGPLLGMNVFDEQMAYLHKANEQFPVMVLPVQELLLAGYQQGDSSLGRGITAMPSLHVAQAFLFFLAMRHKARWAAILFGIFALVIMAGSVHLGYHYAVDGYVSIMVTALIWVLAGHLVAERRFPGMIAPGNPVAAGAA